MNTANRFEQRLHVALNDHNAGNDVKALTKLIALIDDGYEFANTFVAAFYEKGGKGIPKDYQKAFFYYERAVDTTGATEAYLGLARLYYSGLGVDKDYGKAFELYSIVAEESENAIAFLRLGQMYQYGYYVEKDANTARQFFEKAWEKGHLLGLTYLGLLEQQLGHYVKGLGLRLKAGLLGFKIASKNTNDPSLRIS